MKFAVIFQYTSDKELIQAHRPAHREYLMSLRERGQLAVAGPFTDDGGSLIVYEAASADDVERILEYDPFAINGIFVGRTIRPWNPVIANRELFPGG
jgi:uncharacterized protein YciI